MSTYIPFLLTSFPWLTEPEAAGVAAHLAQVEQFQSAADQIQAFALVLDQAGLPPTSTLLLSLAGRGSKQTAVAVARATARARFERAASEKAARAERDGASPAPTALSETAVRQMVEATVESVMATLPGSFSSGEIDERVVKMLGTLAGDVAWLRSTIDTERQLRRYREAHGPLPEHQAPQGPPTTAQRRDVVQQLAGSLERERFKAHVGPLDSADGRDE